MVTISETEVIKQVRINLDEIRTIDGNPSDLSIGNDDAVIDTVIKSKMAEAYRYVLTNASPELLDMSFVTTTNATTSSDGKTASVPLSDMLRFVWANSSSWSHPVFNPIYWNTPEYAQLSDEHTTGTASRPKVGICPSFDSNKKMIVTLYGNPTSGVVGYIKDISSVGSSLTITETLYTAYLYYITSLVLLVLRESQHAENMFGQALAIMKIDTSQKTK